MDTNRSPGRPIKRSMPIFIKLMIFLLSHISSSVARYVCIDWKGFLSLAPRYSLLVSWGALLPHQYHMTRVYPFEKLSPIKPQPFLLVSFSPLRSRLGLCHSFFPSTSTGWLHRPFLFLIQARSMGHPLESFASE